VAQIEVGAKTNEIPELPRLLDPVDLTGRVVTVDALHTQLATARDLVEEKHAHYLMPVKENQHALRADLAALDPEAFSPGAHPV
jgi:predicted transposase YbfD/YdcC